MTWERVGFELEKVLDKDAVIVPELGTQYYKIYRQLKLGGIEQAADRAHQGRRAGLGPWPRPSA